tara:strand:- start:483 stop:602 length:120 start_codon:yes stop_codon:yes gene_type:complete
LYIVNHEFKAGKASKWWDTDTAYAVIAPGGGYYDTVLGL